MCWSGAGAVRYSSIARINVCPESRCDDCLETISLAVDNAAVFSPAYHVRRGGAKARESRWGGGRAWSVCNTTGTGQSKLCVLLGAHPWPPARLPSPSIWMQRLLDLDTLARRTIVVAAP